MELSTVFACVGAGISLVGVTHYLIGIMRHGTKPRMASWVAWLTANGVFTAIALQDGAYIAAAINGMGVATNISVIMASALRKVDMKPSDAMDWWCMLVSVACIGSVLIVPDNKILAATLGMVANLVATAPTFRHAWKKPHEETWQLFAANAFANGLGVASVALANGVELVVIAGPLVATIGNATLVFITAGRKWFVGVEQELARDVRLVEEAIAPVAGRQSE
jgi:hypothetical protein